MTANGIALCQPLRRDQPKLPGLPRPRRLNDRVGILMRREPATNTRLLSGVMQLAADRGGRARPSACRTPQNAEQRAGRQGCAELEPWFEGAQPQRSIPTSRRDRSFPCYAESRLMPSTRRGRAICAAERDGVPSHSALIEPACPELCGVSI